MRGRLFGQLLATFTLLIVFTVVGTTLFLTIRLRIVEARYRLQAIAVIEKTLAATLSDYYVARGNTWAGVDARLDEMVQDSRAASAGVRYALFDEAGRVIAEGGVAGSNLPALRPAQGSPITVGSKRVGSFVMLPTGALNRGVLASARLRPARATNQTLEQQVRPSFIAIAVLIGSLALGLAVLISRRISAPLDKLTDAAQRVAAGDLQVQVPGSAISEVDALATAFNRMAADLAHADQLRRNLTADIAHELRTPLTVMRGKLEGILDGVYPGTPEHIAPVLEEANLLERLIDDLRVLSLAEAGQLPLHRAVVPVSELINDARRSFAEQAAQHQVALNVATAPLDALVQVDPQRMQQVLGNLLANSLRHTPAGGQIDLIATNGDHTARIAVRDTGSGIAPDELPHIFDRFWRGDKARSRAGHRTGLGLAIARQLVEAMGGHISAASELGHGTTITIELPLAA